MLPFLKKQKKFIILVVLIILLGLAWKLISPSNLQDMFFVLFKKNSFQVITFENEKTGDKSTRIKLHINGYNLTCINDPKVFVYNHNNWQPVKTFLPIPNKNQGYFLNNKYYPPEFAMCDLAICTKLEQPITINLIEYTQVNERPAPNSDQKIPVFVTKKLTGKTVKIEYDYYTDKKCKHPETYMVILEEVK